MMTRTAPSQSRRCANPGLLGRDRRSLSFVRLGRALFALIALIPAACFSLPVAGPPTAPPIGTYVVAAPDLLRVNILPDPQIVQEVRVRPDGMISIDLVGDVRAAGNTPPEIAASIQREIRRYKLDAVVTVSLVGSVSQFVTIYGEVGSPGVFPLTSETRVAEAIGRVGGVRPFASLNGVRIIRTEGADAQIIDVRLNDIQRGDLSTNFVLTGGDLVVVPPTFLARVGYVMQQIFFPFQPALSAVAQYGQAATGLSAATN